MGGAAPVGGKEWEVTQYEGVKEGEEQVNSCSEERSQTAGTFPEEVRAGGGVGWKIIIAPPGPHRGFYKAPGL